MYDSGIAFFSFGFVFSFIAITKKKRNGEKLKYNFKVCITTKNVIMQKKSCVQVVKKFLVCQTVNSIDNILIIRLI